MADVMFEKLRLQYQESQAWTQFFLGLTITLLLASISMGSKDGVGAILFNISIFLGVMSIMFFMMKEYRFYVVKKYLNSSIHKAKSVHHYGEDPHKK